MPISVVGPRTTYMRLPPASELPANVLFAVTFADEAALDSPRSVRVKLQPLAGAGLAEVWHAEGEVNSGVDGPIRFAADDHFLAGVIEVDERDHGGIMAATRFAYGAIAEFQASSRYPHLLRTWNYFDAINDGAGDSERYREFCSGRVAGLAGPKQGQHPAATVIGRRDGDRVLQVYWLAGQQPGIAIENPRQLSAYRYPRQYGQTPPHLLARDARRARPADDFWHCQHRRPCFATRRQRCCLGRRDSRQSGKPAGAGARPRASVAGKLRIKFADQRLRTRSLGLSSGGEQVARTPAVHSLPDTARRRVPRRSAGGVRLSARRGLTRARLSGWRCRAG